MELTTQTQSTELVEAPDCRSAISVTGKSRTDKALSVLSAGLTSNTMAFAASLKGKVGTTARAGLGDDAAERAAAAAGVGNFTPLYELIVLLSVKCVQPIRSGADYERARGFIRGLRDNLKDGGYSRAGKLTAEAVGYDKCLRLFEAADAMIELRRAENAERRARIAAEKAAQQEGATTE